MRLVGGRGSTNSTGNMERGELIEITASFEKLTDRNNTFHELSGYDETRENNHDKVGYSFGPNNTFRPAITHLLQGDRTNKSNKPHS